MGRDAVLEAIQEGGDAINLEEIDGEGDDALVVHWSRSHVVAAVEASQTVVSVRKNCSILTSRNVASSNF